MRASCISRLRRAGAALQLLRATRLGLGVGWHPVFVLPASLVVGYDGSGGRCCVGEMGDVGVAGERAGTVWAREHLVSPANTHERQISI
ncbi:hypothetical protein RTBOTA2_006727 [Rhodotorula toruloides]|nr:hypothetical protein RTBOTA2_006727 [Rhodotorula toruloides]